MARLVQGSTRVVQPLELDTIRGFHVDCEESLKLYYSPTQANTNHRFFSYSKAELSEELAQKIAELELRSSFVILTMLEAYFRIDYRRRVNEKRKDALSSHFRSLYRIKQERASLESDIFDAWMNHTSGTRRMISDLKRLFKYRHWFAHGRYWTLRVGRHEYDYETIHQLAEQAIASFPFAIDN